ncbi:MAG TPA: hypothetical protein VN837_05055 [Chloroflexota bacterium]|nr:hypothetical protein [Chloroflexota bacterium]
MSKGDGEIQHPSTALVKYLGVAAAAVGVLAAVLDVALPLAQQLGKNKQAKDGLGKAISMSVLLSLARSAPRVLGQVRKLRAQLNAEVAA